MIAALRKRAPMRLRIAVARIRRNARDRQSGALHAMVDVSHGGGEDDRLPILVSVRQPIRRTAFHEGKLVNLALGASRLDRVVLAPGQIFSFWRLVGRPTTDAGFAMGRAIRDDALHGETGGGLCQVSGLAYELGLRAGLEVLERHPHSRDLYAEQDRFTLLGLDATVVWPWKDLRLRNPHGQSVCLRFEMGDGWVEGRVLAGGEIAAFELEVEREDFADHRKVKVSRHSSGDESQLVSSDSYVIDPH